MPETTTDPPDDERSNRLAIVLGIVLVLAVFLVALLLFRRRDEDTAVTFPSGLPPIPTAPATTAPPTLAPLPTVAAGPETTSAPTRTPVPTTIVTGRTVFPPAGTTTPAPTTPPTTEVADDDDGGGTPITAGHSSDKRAALREYADDLGATIVSDAVAISGDDYAMVVVSGSGQLVSWDGEAWSFEEQVSTPSSITRVETADVTGDASPDFVVSLSGMNRPGGVYGRTTFQFDFLPFNTADGRRNFVAGLTLDGNRLESPFRDVNGTRTLLWRWTGRMFETS